ncbi:hypothetical protein LCGC14_0477660 [marine sediment metagenome]|uniref:Uncharacterized protein n=1 Tax=marine sediment metagenome TaxID=412755 RepID=A0A0F9SAB9_9ZZZZ
MKISYILYYLTSAIILLSLLFTFQFIGEYVNGWNSFASLIIATITAFIIIYLHLEYHIEYLESQNEYKKSPRTKRRRRS